MKLHTEACELKKGKRSFWLFLVRKAFHSSLPLSHPGEAQVGHWCSFSSPVWRRRVTATATANTEFSEEWLELENPGTHWKQNCRSPKFLSLKCDILSQPKLGHQKLCTKRTNAGPAELQGSESRGEGGSEGCQREPGRQAQPQCNIKTFSTRFPASTKEQGSNLLSQKHLRFELTSLVLKFHCFTWG